MPSLSIIIPTYQRPDILRECLLRIEAQTIRDQLEVIVVSDGEDARTRSLFADISFPFPLNFSSVPKSQQGVARNRGVERAQAPYVLFIGDDMFLERDACEKHLQSHREGEPRAVLGHVAWDPAVGITPAMQWLDRTGWQFGYKFLSPYAHKEIPSEIQHRFTYTSQISLPLEIARRFPFREDAVLYGWEDIEWGMRLKDAGIPLFYEPDAKALHHHHLSDEDSLKRMETLGRSAVIFQKFKPEMRIVPAGFKLLLYRLAALLPTTGGRHRKAFLREIGRIGEGEGAQNIA